MPNGLKVEGTKWNGTYKLIIMITEQYVSFETARMLKEAGFDVPCFNQYTERGTIWHCDCPENFNKSQCATSCPTQALAARWLREVHKLNIYACFDYIEFDKGNSSYFFARENVDINDYTSVYFSLQSYDSYEEAIEGGLIETLKTILNCK